MKILPTCILRATESPLQRGLQNARYIVSKTEAAGGIWDAAATHGTPKTLVSRTIDIQRTTAKQINAIARARQKKVDAFKHELFGDLLVTEYSPSNIIYEIKGRAKSTDSIIEKANTRKWYTKDEILRKMTDLNGTKTVLRDGSRPQANRVLDRYIKAIEDRKIELLEIENKRPIACQGMKGDEAQMRDYVSPERLQDLRDRANSIQTHKIDKEHFKDIDYTDGNYSALHLLFRFPGENWVFEEQIMGYDVAVYKDLDDIIWKILNNKNVDKKYKPIIDIIKPLTEPGNARLEEQFDKYRGNVFLFQRDKAPHITKHKTEWFLPIKDEIDNDVVREKLDMNYLYELKLRCEGKIK